MIVCADSEQNHKSSRQWRERFDEMLPQIRNQASFAFRNVNSELQEELVAETVALAYCSFVQLMRRGRGSIVYPSPLATFAIKQVRCGRRAAARLNVNDVTSKHAQKCKGIVVESLDLYDDQEDGWREVLVEDKRSTPAQLASIRLDFEAWLRILPPRQRRIAAVLATGESTAATAKRFDVSSGRISQLRGELKGSWEAFQGEAEASAAVA